MLHKRLYLMKTLGAFAIVSVLGASTLAAQQTGTLAGRVTDASTGQAIASVGIFIENLELGTLTQASGTYILQNVPAGSHTLTVQRLGYREVTASIQIGAGQTVTQNFEIDEVALQLDELIVTGTPGGTQRRAIGNAVATVDVGAITAAPVTTLQQVLQSRIPGVTLHVGGGMVGADGGPIRIRGSSSIGLPNDPIVFIDGRRMNAERSFRPGTTQTGSYSRLDDINPADIESIEIIKGPAAATLYGTEASNGVIQIITKRGAAGETRFDASVELGQNWVRHPEDKFNLPNVWGRDKAGQLVSMQLYTLEQTRADNNASIGFFDSEGDGLPGGALFSNGLLQRYSLSATGGTEFLQYFASVNRNDLEGFVPWNTDVGTGARLNVTATINDKVSLDLQSSYLKRDTRHPGRLWAEFRRSRVSTAEDLNALNPTVRRGYGIAPFEIWRDSYEQINDVDRNSWGLTLNYTPMSWLTTRAIFGNDVSEEFETQLYRLIPNGPSSAWREGRKRVDLLKIVNRTLDLSASANFQATDLIGSTTSVGLQYYKKTNWTIRASGEEFATGSLETVGATAKTEGREDRFENATVGAYFQQQFDYDQRIFLTGAVRMDDNSAFGQDFDVVIYPKLSGTWVVSEEDFWSVDFINQLRLRTAWGKAGQQPDVFAATRLYQARAGTGDVSYLTPEQFGNPDLGPEVGQELELGFDAAVFDDLIDIEYTYYKKTTNDAIVNRPVSPSQGFPGFQFVNIGKISNWGHEIAVNARLLTTNQHSADLGFSLGTTYTKINDMGGINEIAVRRTRRHVQGYPLAAQFERKVVSAEWVTGPQVEIGGVLSGGSVTNVLCDGGTGRKGRERGGAAVPCVDAPRLHWGRQGEPTWTASLFPSVTLFNNWRASALIYGQGGNMVGHDALFNAEIAWRNTYKTNVNNDLLYVGQKSVAPPAMGFYRAGFVKIRELSLQYTFSEDLAGGLGLSAASLTVAGRNLGILWQDQRFSWRNHGAVGDPEKGSIAEQEFIGEPTSGDMPPASHITVTARVSF